MEMIKKMGAVALAAGSIFMSACSEDSGKVANGVAEEQGIADAIVLAGKVQVMAKKVSADSSSGGVQGDVAVPVTIQSAKFCTLDSVTFAVSEKCYKADVNGQGGYELKINDQSWRYGLLTVNGNMDEDSLSYHSVIDAEKGLETNVNILTEWEYYLADKLVTSGMNVEEALTKARRGILDSLGLGEDYADFGQMSLVGTSRSDAALVAANFVLDTRNVEEGGEYERVDELVGYNIGVKHVYNDAFWKWLNVDRPDEEFLSLADKHVSNVASVFLNLGRCEGENLGRIVRYDDFDFGPIAEAVENFGFNLKCEDGLWFFVAKEYEHQVGSMTDDRDGRTYKTTTIDVNGKSVTWMAEDLQYDQAKSRCYKDVPENCDQYGRLYYWMDLMKLDTTGFIESLSEDPLQSETLEECMEMQMEEKKSYIWYSLDSVQERETYEWFGLDSTAAYMLCMDQQVRFSEILKSIDSQNHQGVCPDGWRIPSVKDWNMLNDFLDKNMGAKLMERDWIEYKPCSFCGLDSADFYVHMRTMDVVDFSAVPVFNSKKFASIPGIEEENNQSGLNGDFVEVYFAGMNPFASIKSVGYFDSGRDELLSVRCIKAD